MNGQLEENSYTQLLLRHIHELNQPLTVIKAYIGGCELRLQNNELRAAQIAVILKKINEHVELFKNKISSMQKIIPSKQNISFSHLILELTSLFSLEIKYYAIRLVLDLAPDLDEIYINSDLLKLVLFRLLKQCIHTIEKKGIQNAELIIQTKIAKENMLNITLKNNFSIIAVDLKRDLTYCRSLLFQNGGSMFILPNGVSIPLNMFYKEN